MLILMFIRQPTKQKNSQNRQINQMDRENQLSGNAIDKLLTYTANVSITANGYIVSIIKLFNMNSSFGLEKHNTLM